MARAGAGGCEFCGGSHLGERRCHRCRDKFKRVIVEVRCVNCNSLVSRRERIMERIGTTGTITHGPLDGGRVPEGGENDDE
jgi:hypothetical protein